MNETFQPNNAERSGERQDSQKSWAEAMASVPPFNAEQAQRLVEEEKRRMTDHESESMGDTLTRDMQVAREADLEFARTCPTGGINVTDNEIPSARVLRLANASAAEQRRALSMAENAELSSRAMTMSDDELAQIASAAYQAEMAKQAVFGEEIMPLIEGGKACRIHPYGPASPFSSEFFNSDSEQKFEPISMGIVRSIVEARRRKEVESGPLASDFTVVMNYPKFGAEDGPQYPSGESLRTYIEMCKEFVAESGAENGHGLVLEFGNETNVSRETTWGAAKPFERNAPDFSAVCDPKEYAEMYFATASELKKSYPELQCSLAGAAFYDPEWIRTVCDRIQELQSEQGIDGQLIDVISFHDYRKNETESMPQVYHDGRDVRIDDSALSYDEQIASMSALAQRFGARLDCGEFGFGETRDGVFYDNPDAQKRMADKTGGRTTKTWNNAARVRYGH